MPLTTTIGAGALIGGIAAFAVYASASPREEAAARTVVATFGAVPTPTVTQPAEGCEPPAVLTGSECVLTTPGRTIVVTPPTGSNDAYDDSDGRADDSAGRADDSAGRADDSDGRNDDDRGDSRDD